MRHRGLGKQQELSIGICWKVLSDSWVVLIQNCARVVVQRHVEDVLSVIRLANGVTITTKEMKPSVWNGTFDVFEEMDIIKSVVIDLS